MSRPSDDHIKIVKRDGQWMISPPIRSRYSTRTWHSVGYGPSGFKQACKMAALWIKRSYWMEAE